MNSIAATGVTSGFGSNWLSLLDSKVEANIYVLARDRGKYNRLLASNRFKNPLHFVECNLASMKSVEVAAQFIRNQTDSLDVLINNAGVWSGNNRCLSEDDIELTLAVNQLAPYKLTGELLPLLSNASSARIVNTASFRHSDAKIHLTDIELKEGYSAAQAYCNSKLFTILFTKQLSRRFENSNLTVNCFDPGIVDTPMLRQALPPSMALLYPLFRRLVARTPDKGAETGVFLSTDTSCENINGRYFKDMKERKTSKLALDSSLENWLWSESERLTEFTYPLRDIHVST